MDKDINVFEGSFFIIIWSVFIILIFEVILKNIKIRLWLEGEFLVIINDGKVIYKNMKKVRYNIGDLLM